MTLPVARPVASSIAVMEDTAMRHSRTLALAGVIVTALLLQPALYGQAGRSAEAELRAAQYRAEVRGDWTGAIADYERLSKADDRDVAARALVALGDAYEKTGAGDPKPVFDRVVRTFADQKDVAAVASRRLAALSRGGSQELTSRRIWASDAFNPIDISSDGALAVGTKSRTDAGNNQQQDLLLRSVTSGEISLLVASSAEGGLPPGRAGAASLSPDGRQVAFVWGGRTDGVVSFNGPKSIRVVGTEAGASPRVVLGPDDNISIVTLGGWSSDATAILCVFQARSDQATTIAWVSIADGAVRPLGTFSRNERVVSSRVSDDGQWIAYVRYVLESGAQHVRVMRADGQDDAGIVMWTGTNSDAIWTPDGSHILFHSDRLNERALYAVRVQNGRAAGEPFLVRKGMGGRPVRVFASGGLYYTESGPQGGNSVFVAERSATGSTIVQAFAGNVPNISPDGRFVATAATNGLTIRSLDTGEERFYEHAGVGMNARGQYLYNRWLPDSSGLILWITGPAGGAFHRLDRATGEFRSLLPASSDGRMLSRAGAVSADGETFYVLARASDGGAWNSIAWVDLQAGNVRSTFSLAGELLPANTNVFSIATSPDESNLAIAYAVPGDLSMHLAIVDANGGSLRDLATYETPRLPDRIGWTEDGRAVVVGMLQGGIWRLMRVPVGGGPPQPDGIDLSQLTGSITFPDVDPARGDLGGISRDGSRVVFGAASKVSHEVWALENVLGFLSTR
jgi:Tol biopolymer transport system component